MTPDARGHGVSTALLHHMEEALRACGCAAVRLESTVTAHSFYLASGYRDLEGCERQW